MHEVNEDAPIQVGHVAYLRDRDWPDMAQGKALGEVVAVEESLEVQLRKRLVLRPIRPFRFVGQVEVYVPDPSAGRGEGAGQ
jgi:hypothetical protein